MLQFMVGRDLMVFIISGLSGEGRSGGGFPVLEEASLSTVITCYRMRTSSPWESCLSFPDRLWEQVWF